MQNKIIGTGLSGLVGSRVVELLGKKYSFSNCDLSTGTDITNTRSFNKSIGEKSGEVVLHLAAFTDVDLAFQQKGNKNGLCYKVNVNGTRNVAQYCAKHGKYLIHISTDFIFDGNKKTKYLETDKPSPIEWYGQTKFWAEQEVQKAGGKYAIVRIAFPFRSNFKDKLDLVRSIKQKLTSDKPLQMFSDQVITPTFIDDIAIALDVLISKKPKGIFHVVGSTPISPYNLAVKIAQALDLNYTNIEKTKLSEYLKTANRPYQKSLTISNKKIKSKLGIKMSSIDEALRKVKLQMNS